MRIFPGITRKIYKLPIYQSYLIRKISRDYKKCLNNHQLMHTFKQVGNYIRDRKLLLGRDCYSLSVAHSVLQAILCGYKSLTLVELGVGAGAGLRELSLIAKKYSSLFEVQIDVIGFDNASGLPKPDGYKDHPEIWSMGEFLLPNFKKLEQELSENTTLIIGDVKKTIPDFCKLYQIKNDVIGFVSVDLDYYSSTKDALNLLQMTADKYLPALPIYVDDTNNLISYSSYSGERLAIEEFNEENIYVKIEEKANFDINNFFIGHFLNHPIRTGTLKPVYPLTIFKI